jgi:hypothetical protein
MNNNQLLLTNLFVALKAKPLAILAGPVNSGKEGLVEKLAGALSSKEVDRLQLHTLTGHPWWATASSLQGLAEIQTRYTSEMVLDIFEEARLPQNSDTAFIVCFARISQAELQNFFTDLAFQLMNDRIMRIGDVHLDKPIPFPSNLFIIGTMDIDEYCWWDTDLMSKASVIQTGNYSLPDSLFTGKKVSINVQELATPIRDTNLAYKRVKGLLAGEKQPFEHFFQIQEVLHSYNVSTSNRLMDEAVIYLANAWSNKGDGIFASEPRANLEIATDILIAQMLLPCIRDVVQKSPDLRKALHQVLHLYFPYSCEYLDQIV